MRIKLSWIGESGREGGERDTERKRRREREEGRERKPKFSTAGLRARVRDRHTAVAIFEVRGMPTD